MAALQYLVVSSLGFFAIVAQTLLFRDFLTVYEGSELGIASFFCSWLVWVGLGGFLGRSKLQAFSQMTHRFELMPLVYIPAYLLQWVLIHHSRAIAGVGQYELFPFVKMFPVSFIANAPVSLVTGLLFTLACRWASRTGRIPVAGVYIREAVGGFAGGIAVTGLLAAGVSPESIFVWTALPMAAVAAAARSSRRSLVISLAVVVAAGACLACRADRAWRRRSEAMTWQRLLPVEGFEGSFSTPQARYLYGTYEGVFHVMAWESVIESVPADEAAGEVLAIHLSQKPDARRILVVGQGSLSVCLQALTLPQTEKVTWLNPDPAYARRLLEAVPEETGKAAEKLDIPERDVREFLAGTPGAYDLAILSLPDAASLVLNRYLTREFFETLAGGLTEDGVAGVRVSGGENVMGTELANMGASVFRTLNEVFPHSVIKPGDETWIIASRSNRLSSSASILSGRFRSIPGGAGIYPPEGLVSLYREDRMEFQRKSYEEAKAKDAGGLLLNTDGYPKSLLHSLLFVIRRSGAGPSVTPFVLAFAGFGLAVLLAAAGMYAVLRCSYMTGVPAPAGPAPFDHRFLVLSAGAAGMGMNIILMFLYQARFGSLFLHIGMLSALFMVGLSAGAMTVERVLVRLKPSSHPLLLLGIVPHAAVMLAVPAVSAGAGGAAFALLFFICGALSGIYVPLAAAGLKASGVTDREAGGSVELNDHAGGALGALVTGLVLLPVLGSVSGAAAVAAVLAVNLVVLVPRLRRRTASADRFDRAVRAGGYVLVGIGVFLTLVAGLCRWTEPEGACGGAALKEASAVSGEVKAVERTFPGRDGKPVQYLSLEDGGGKVTGYIFSTEGLAGGVQGYGGPMVLGLKTDRDGTLQAVKIIRSRETPAYLDVVNEWKSSLLGKNVFRSDGMQDVDSVSGATLTSSAVVRGVREAGTAFAAGVQGGTVEPEVPSETPAPFDYRVAVIALLLAAAAALRYSRSAAARGVFLVVCVVTAGWWLNLQYSTDHVLSLLEGALPQAGFNVGFVLVVIVPVAVLFLGNVYCGYLCPFGAAQELIGYLGEWLTGGGPDSRVWRYVRLVKYVLLFVLVGVFALTWDRRLTSADPLVTVFGGERAVAVTLLVIGILLLSLVFPRFWCRALCPAGAFLSLLNGLRWYRKLFPGINPHRCPYGIGKADELDCLCCYRCRAAGREKKTGRAGWGAREIGLAAAAAVCAVMVTALAAGSLRKAGKEEQAATSATHRVSPPVPGIPEPVTGAVGTPARDADIEKIKRMIREGKLSGHEAKHYRTFGEEPEKKDPPAESGGRHRRRRGGRE